MAYEPAPWEDSSDTPVTQPTTINRRRGGTTSELRGEGPGPAPLPPTQESITPAVQGAAEGFMGGVAKYPAALMAMAADRIRNPTATSPLSYKDALAIIRSENDRSAQEHPVQYLGGNLVGGAATGLMTGGGGFLANTGKTAAQGAVGGYTANNGELTDVGDAAKGAGVGAILGSAAHALGAGANKAAAWAKDKFVKSIIEGDKSTVGQALAAAESRGLSNPDKAEIVQRYGYRDLNDYLQNGTHTTQKTPSGLTKEDVLTQFEGQHNDPGTFGVRDMFGASAADVGRTAAGLAIPLAAGSTGAYAGASFAPEGYENTGATLGALMGGGVTVPIAKQLLLKSALSGMNDTAGMAMIKYPNAVPNLVNTTQNVIRGTGTNAGVSSLRSPNKSDTPYEPAPWE